jgi:undecaprenyl-diphosphatase
MAEGLNSAFSGLDRAVMLWGDGLKDGVLKGLLNFISLLCAYLGKGGIFFILAAVVLLLFRKTRKAGLASLLAIGVGALLVNIILKPLVARPRPYLSSDEFFAVWQRAGAHTEKEFSFPSGHTNVAAASVTALFLCLNKKWSWGLLLVIPLMGFSRIYLAVHYFTDVITGSLLGILYATAAYFIVNAAAKKFPRAFGLSAET